jgi:hypothetical protein
LVFASAVMTRSYGRGPPARPVPVGPAGARFVESGSWANAGSANPARSATDRVFRIKADQRGKWDQCSRTAVAKMREETGNDKERYG